MPRGVPHPELRMLTAAECAERIHCHETDWWGIAAASDILVKGRIDERGKTFWTNQAVALFIASKPRGRRGESRAERLHRKEPAAAAPRETAGAGT